MQYKLLQDKVDNLIGKIGTDKLINCLKQIELEIDYNSDHKFVLIKKIVLEYFDVIDKEIQDSGGKKPQVVSARRMLYYFLKLKTQIPGQEIRRILDLDRNKYKRYKDYINNVIENRNVDPALSKAIIEIAEIYETKLQAYGKQ